MKLTEMINEKERMLDGTSFEYLKELTNRYFEKFSKDSEICYKYYLQTKKEFTKEFYDVVFEEIGNWEEISISPYSTSAYNSKNISWGYKPENSLRLADHWNFESQSQIHCLMEDETKNNHMMLCKYVDGVYKIIKDYTEEYGDDFIYGMA